MLVFDTMNSKTKDVLDAWLKYGTVFLIYRLCSYYFFEHDNPNAELFDKASLRLVLFILLGFTLYYLLVKPYIPLDIQHPIFKNIANDTLMFGTVLASMHLMESFSNPVDYSDPSWIKSAGLILLAFASYRVFIDPFIPSDKLSSNVRPIVHDWAQFATFLVAFQLLQGKSVMDQQWILRVLFVLLGFTGYHLVTKKLLVVN
jgi:hypothetical protein